MGIQERRKVGLLDQPGNGYNCSGVGVFFKIVEPLLKAT
jgi:hypothetical protein